MLRVKAQNLYAKADLLIHNVTNKWLHKATTGNTGWLPSPTLFICYNFLEINIMYYEEKMVNGVLMCRTDPDGEWQQMTIENMSGKIIDLQSKVERLQKAINSAKAFGESSESPFYEMMKLLSSNSSELKL